MPEHHSARPVEMLVQVQCPACSVQELRELALAVLDRRAMQVLASSSSRSKANSTASVFIARSQRSRSKTGMPSLPQITTSPSIRQERQESAATAAAIAG